MWRQRSLPKPSLQGHGLQSSYSNEELSSAQITRATLYFVFVFSCVRPPRQGAGAELGVLLRLQGELHIPVSCSWGSLCAPAGGHSWPPTPGLPPALAAALVYIKVCGISDKPWYS